MCERVEQNGFFFTAGADAVRARVGASLLHAVGSQARRLLPHVVVAAKAVSPSTLVFLMDLRALTPEYQADREEFEAGAVAHAGERRMLKVRGKEAEGAGRGGR